MTQIDYKKILFCCLIVLAILLMGACSPNGENSGDPEEPSVKPISSDGNGSMAFSVDETNYEISFFGTYVYYEKEESQGDTMRPTSGVGFYVDARPFDYSLLKEHDVKFVLDTKVFDMEKESKVSDDIRTFDKKIQNPEKISEETKEIPLFASGWGNYPAGLLEDVRKFYDTCPDIKMSVYVDGILAGSTWVRLEFITQLQ